MSELKIHKKFFCHDMKNNAKLEVVFTFVSKLTWGLWWILAWALENLNNSLFNGMPLTKLYYVRVKKVTRSTRCSVKTLSCLGNKWIAKLTKLFTHVLQNRCSESIKKFSRKLASQVVFFNGQYIYFYNWKVNLKILWNHIMKNFQLKYCQCDSVIFPRNISFWRL